MRSSHHHSNASLSEVHNSVPTSGKGNKWRRLFSFLGPAYLVSVGYMDPGNWATDLAGGSQFGYSLIWVLLMSNIMALLLQSLSSRLGIVRGLDLAQANRATYSKPPCNLFEARKFYFVFISRSGYSSYRPCRGIGHGNRYSVAYRYATHLGSKHYST